MKLFIANATRQTRAFAYRIPGEPGVKQLTIQIGGQVQVPGDLSSQDINYIIKAHRKYGLIDVNEIDRTKPFVGICYSLDKPVPVDKLQRLMIHNNSVLVERGREIRKNAAVAINAEMERQVENPEMTIENLEIEIIEDSKDGSGLSEGIRVTRNPEKHKDGGSRRSRKKKPG